MLVSAALMSLVASNLFPIVEMTARGSTTRLRLWECLRGVNDGLAWPFWLLLAVTLLFPLCELTNMLYSLLGRQRAAPGERSRLMQLLDGLRPWSMILMYMGGMLVSISRMDTMAVMLPGVALVAMGVLIILLAALLVIDTSDLRK